MNKVKFIRTALKNLEVTAKQLNAESNGNPNGNRINAVIRKAEKAAYDSGFFATGEVSTMNYDHHGKPYQLQNGPDWSGIFRDFVKLYK